MVRVPCKGAAHPQAAVRVLGGTPRRMAEQIRTDLDRWGKVVKANNIRAE